MSKFEIKKENRQSKARLSEITTAHGKFQTPCFIPCATVGAVKTLTPEEVKNLGFEIILANTYHLYLRPGVKLIKKFGGLHKFTLWPGPLLTDSGGFQVFSLRRKRQEQEEKPIVVKVSGDGAIFRSHLDGSLHKFTPEKVLEIQRDFGSDIVMVLDECTEYPATFSRAQRSMELTNYWAQKSIEHWQKMKSPARQSPDGSRRLAGGKNQALFGIIQGSTYKNLRVKAAKFITSLPFDGLAIGGVSVGEGKRKMFEAVRWVLPYLPEDKPRYLMGVGEPEDIIKAVSLGIDMFDCVLPTRLARHGVAYIKLKTKNEKRKTTTKKSKLFNNLTNQQFHKLDLRKSAAKEDRRVIDENCGCYACQNKFSRAYLAHLTREKEVLGIRLLTLHNLYFISQLMKEIRNSI